MKIGLILECPVKGTDHQVYEYLVNKICPEMHLEIVGNTNKKELINNCGIQAKLLLESANCEHVVIIWDAMPTWGGTACRRTDVDLIRSKLADEQVELEMVKLICMEPELEGWLLVDGRGVTSYKKEMCHPHPVKKYKGTKLSANSDTAKKIISRYLERRYNDVSDAIRIVKLLPDYDRIARNHSSFNRLAKYIDEVC